MKYRGWLKAVGWNFDFYAILCEKKVYYCVLCECRVEGSFIHFEEGSDSTKQILSNGDGNGMFSSELEFGHE